MCSLVYAIRRGWPMTYKTLWGGIQVILIISGTVGIIIAPIGIIKIESLWISIIAWLSWGIAVAFVAVVIGLCPYRGQKEITKDVEKVRDDFIQSYDDERKKSETIALENQKLKEEISKLNI